MPIVLVRSMKKKMKQVLQKSVEIGHASNLKRLEQPKNNLEEVVTFQNGEQNKLEDITKNIKLKIVLPTKNHPPKLRCIKIELEIP